MLEITEKAAALDELRERARELERFRHLVGRASGSGLEVLVIETLNVILKGSGYRAEDREDVRAEDFWIVGLNGDVALAEVKGQNTHIRRDDVNQVDSHRDEVGEAAADLPGLLIVNIFRGHAGLDQRELPVADQAIRRASGSNVLALRTYDLFNLLHQGMSGTDAATVLIDALESGGGWLEVTAEGHALHS
jgi:hypothetical protein